MATIRLPTSFAFFTTIIPAVFASWSAPSSASLPSTLVLDQTARMERCESRQKYGHPDGCGQCANVIPNFAAEDQDEDTWLVAVGVDRTSVGFNPNRRNLRGRGRAGRSPTRKLPHEYFVIALEATLGAIATLEPGASITVAVFSEGRGGSLLDEMGVPVNWDIMNGVCEDLGLHCTQELILLNSLEISLPEAIECAASADIFLSSEDEFSHATAMVSKNVRVLTDRWDAEEDQTMITLEPKITVAGMTRSTQAGLTRIVQEYQECMLTTKAST